MVQFNTKSLLQFISDKKAKNVNKTEMLEIGDLTGASFRNFTSFLSLVWECLKRRRRVLYLEVDVYFNVSISYTG